MKKRMIFCILPLVVMTALLFTGCKDFTMSGAESVTLSGPDATVTLQKGEADFDTLTDLCSGTKVKQVDNPNAFGLSKITFSQSGVDTAIYPAIDGSTVLCLYSLNTEDNSYLVLSQKDWDLLVSIMTDHGIRVVYTTGASSSSAQ